MNSGLGRAEPSWWFVGWRGLLFASGRSASGLAVAAPPEPKSKAAEATNDNNNQRGITTSRRSEMQILYILYSRLI